MKRKFTFLMAALALLTFLTPAAVGWGQTRTEVVAYTLEPASGTNNSYASNCDIEIDGITWNLTGNSTMQPWRIGGKNLSGVDRTLYSKTPISDDISKIEVTHGSVTLSAVNSWTVIVSKNSDFSNPVSTLTPTFTANTTTTINRPDGADWSGCYFNFVYNVNAGSSNQYLQFTGAVFYKETTTTLQDSDLSLSPAALTFDLYNNFAAQTVSYTTSSTGAITITPASPTSYFSYVHDAENKTITVTPLAVTPSTQTVTINQAADVTYNVGSADFTVSITNSAPQYTVTYKANGGTGEDIPVQYYAGENVTVAANTFTYAGHAFTEWNTSSNGLGTSYDPDDVIENIGANIDLYAQWQESNETVDVLNIVFTGVSAGTGYTNWSDKEGNSGAVYAGNSAGGASTSNPSIQLRTSNSNSGIVSTSSGGKFTKIVVTWNSSTSNGRTLNIYGKNTAYSAASDLYGDNAGTLIGTIVYGTSTELTINDDYNFIGIRSANSALYLDEVRITWVADTDPAVATTTTINVPSGFNTNIYQGTSAGTLTATVKDNNDDVISGATVTWESTNTDVATITDGGVVTLVAAGTTTIKAIYAGITDQYKPSTGTYELTVTNTDPNAPGTENNPYTVAQAIAATPASGTTSDVYIHGIVSAFHNTSIVGDGSNYRYYISDDGTTTNQLLVYKGKGLNNVAFSNANDLLVGDEVTILGGLTTYNSTPEVASDNYLISLNRPASITLSSYSVEATAAETEGTLTVTYSEIETDLGVEIYWYTDETGATTTSKPGWIAASINASNNVYYLIEENTGTDARTAYFKVYGLDADGDDVYSDLVTITQAAPTVTATYTLINSVSNLVSGKRYIIASGTNGSVCAMGGQNTNNRGQVEVTATNGVIPETEGVYEVVIFGPDVEGGYTIYDVKDAKYLAATGTGSSNYLRELEDINDRARWTIIFSEDAAVITSITTETDRKIIRYNSSSSCFSCYGSGQKSVYLFGKDNESTVSYKKNDIAGYGSSERGGYYLIASPVGQVTPAAGNGFLTNNYDLYAFDQSASNAEVWRNYEATNFNLVSGRGYLYANSGNTTELTFEGMPYVGNGQVILSYDGDSDWAGWNLIGNPYATNATIPGNQSYYTLNTNRDELIAGESSTIGAMEGIFVKATAAGESVTFTPTRGNKGDTDLNSRVVLNLNGNHGVIDRAIVRFSEGGALPKFMMNPENTRIYIRQDNENFAVLNSNGQGEMPVNFKAAEDGTYTISVATENLDVNYLHLIDNKTGMDVDLLATPSYTFEGKRTDYASRFRLVFDANNGNNETSDEFAFMSDGNLIVNGTGTVQVIDMLGRQIFSHEVNSAFRIPNFEFAPGVYVLRLINGNNVKTQKIVIK